MIGFVLGLAAGVAAGALVGRRRARPGEGEVGAHLLPDPALNWLLRAHQAIGVWVSELGAEGPRSERAIDADRAEVAAVIAVDRRLERARDEEDSGVERLDAGTLVFQASDGVAVGLLLPPGHPAGAPAVASADLSRLLAGIQRRPQLLELAQAGAQESSIESLGSVGLRVAYQLERITGGPVIVAARDPAGIRVVGVSGRADRRLLDTVAAPESAVARVGRGELEQSLVRESPVGQAVADRRHRAEPVLVLPLAAGSRTVGSVALWLPGGAEPTGTVLAELREAIRRAGPGIARAAESRALEQAALVDPLTGLPNRRGMERAMGRHGASEGSLIVADIDRFKQLNDTLGHPAGDAALVHFARIIQEQVRAGDAPARVGGEEFAVWLPGAPLEVGVRIAERIRMRLSTTEWAWKGRHWPLTASFGVAACPETARRPENLPGQADAALYVAKKGGRDRVEAAARAGSSA